jgi:hypothetical protein
VGVAQFRPRIDARLVGEPVRQGLVRAERLGPLTGGRKRENQPGHQRFVQRAVGSGLPELGEEHIRHVRSQRDIGSLFHGREALIVQ